MNESELILGDGAVIGRMTAKNRRLRRRIRRVFETAGFRAAAKLIGQPPYIQTGYQVPNRSPWARRTVRELVRKSILEATR